MKVYGTSICIDCRNWKAICQSRGLTEIEYIDITENTNNLKEFLILRDKEKEFDTVKEHGGIGIPCFVKEDGSITFDMNKACSWIGQPPIKEEEIAEKREEGCRSCQ